MPLPTIRPARADEYDEVARVWMNSWVSTGLEDASDFLLAKLQARGCRRKSRRAGASTSPTTAGTLAAMLALHLPDRYLDQLFVAPEYQGRGLGRQCCSLSRESICRMKSVLRCVRENEKAWRWYEREGFVFEQGAGRADDRVCHEILSMEERVDRSDRVRTIFSLRMCPTRSS